MLAPSAFHGPRGTTRWRVMPLARALAAAGGQVRVVVPPYDWPPDAGRRWLDGGVEVVNVALPPAGRAVGAPWLAAAMARAARQFRPDLVHGFKPKGYAGLAGLWLSQRGLPLVQDGDDWETGWNAAAGYPLAWQQFFVWQERTGLRRARAVTVASRWLEQLATHLRGSADGVFYLPNGATGAGSYSQNATRQAARWRHQRPARALLYTRFVETTPDAVWRIWSAVLHAVPAARLLVAGAGFAGEERALHRLASAAGAPDSVSLLGWVPPASLPGVLAAASAALFPVADTPLNRAKSPVRLLDALAGGLPAATEAVGEYGCYVVDGETGLLAAPGDWRALAAATARLLTDRDLAAALGDAAARRAARLQAWPRLADSALAAYRYALEVHR